MDLQCKICNRIFKAIGAEKKMFDFDVIKAEERTAFDEKYDQNSSLSQSELDESTQLAQQIIEASTLTLPLEGRCILDVACGRGELTLGLALHKQIHDCRIFGFDHSPISIEILNNTACGLHLHNDVCASIQDINCLAYRKGMFDVIFGNACLHHFGQVEQVIESVHALLSQGGIAVFAEPFLYGYALVMLALKTGVSSLAHDKQCTPTQLNEMGFFHFIENNIRQRAKRDPAVLEALTDKHLFLYEDFLSLGHKLGFRVSFKNMESDDYYRNKFFADILKTYQITNSEVAEQAKVFYELSMDYLGDSFSSLFSHYKVITLQKL